MEIFVGECGMTETTTMPCSQPLKPDVKRNVRFGCGESARPVSTQRHNVRLAIWLRGWHIEISDVAKA